MRSLVCLLILLASNTLVFGTTFVFKSGKKIEGTILSEDEKTLRIRDADGVAMSLNRSSLDLRAMEALRIQQQEQQEQVVEGIQPLRTDIVSSLAAEEPSLYTNEDLSSYGDAFRDDASPKQRARKAEREYRRLSQECKATGGVSSGKGILRTDVYNVDGRQVHVRGYWADPEDIERAKEICSRAMKAQETWQQAKQQLEVSLHKSDSASRPSTAAVPSK